MTQFAGYENFEACMRENSDKEDPEAYAAAIHHEATGEWPGEKAAGCFDSREEHLDALLTAAAKMDVEPNDEFLDSVRSKVGYDDGEASVGEGNSGGVIDRLLSWGR